MVGLWVLLIVADLMTPPGTSDKTWRARYEFLITAFGTAYKQRYEFVQRSKFKRLFRHETSSDIV